MNDFYTTSFLAFVALLVLVLIINNPSKREPVPVQDIPLPPDVQDYPEKRYARVASMRSAVSVGGHRLILGFEDDLEPKTFTLWVDQKMFDKVVTGDLFIFHYRPDGTVIKYYGPVKEDE